MDDVRNIIIVGSGPAGWTAAIYTARAGLKPLVIAGGLDAGGALMTTTEVENFPGWPEPVLGPELMDKMQSQAEKFGAEVEYEDAIKFDLEGDVKTVVTDSGTYRAKAVILALGSAYKKLGLKGEEALTGKGVSYCATCDGFFFKDRQIAVIGGGDSAATEALFLASFGDTVHLIHRRDQLRAAQVLVDRLQATPNIVIHWNSTVEAVNGEDKVSSLTLKNTVTGELSDLPIQGMFVAIGHAPRTEVLGGAVELDEGGYIKVDSPSTLTNVPGVFAAGDVVDHRYRQAVTAAGQGCAAALDAQMYLASL